VVTVVPVDDPDDERIRDFRGIKDRDLRRLRGEVTAADRSLIIAEGALVIRRLLHSPYRVRSVLVTARGLRALEPDLAGTDAPVYLAPQPVVEAIAGYKFHRGALAAADRTPLPDLAAIADRAALLVATEGVNDHENLGALFRNAAAFGADGMLLDPSSADPLYRRSIRVSMGHVLRVPFARVAPWPDALSDLQSSGFEVLALTPDRDAEDLRHVQPAPSQVLLVGAEGPGLTPAALAAADRRVRIPLAPNVDSLNVATAAAIVLHHLSRGR
jgi:tRNA G18 (ribose-2'-O)-methylase SpoU